MVKYPQILYEVVFLYEKESRRENEAKLWGHVLEVWGLGDLY
jgi:hypothetical protein